MQGIRGACAMVGIVLVGAIGAVGCSTESDDSEARTPAGASTAVNSAVQTDSKGKTIETEPSTQTPTDAPPDPAKGVEVFAESCEACHQDGGKVAGAGPVLAGTGRSDERITTQITNGGGGMQAFGDVLSAEDLANVIAYVKSIK